MSKRGMFKKFRGIDDRTLGAALTNHAQVLGGVAGAATMLLRERRLLMVWRVLVTVGLVWALLWSHTPDSLWEWVR